MSGPEELVRHLNADEITALGVLPDPEVVSPTTDRHNRTPDSTADVHTPGVLESSSYDVAEGDPFPPPRPMTEE